MLVVVGNQGLIFLEKLVVPMIVNVSCYVQFVEPYYLSVVFLAYGSIIYENFCHFSFFFSFFFFFLFFFQTFFLSQTQ